jgi:hypothetical protein
MLACLICGACTLAHPPKKANSDHIMAKKNDFIYVSSI